MITPRNTHAAFTPRRLIPVCALLALSVSAASAQNVPAAPANNATEAQVLAKYDKNHDGRLDESELAVKNADDANAARGDDETIVLSPFQVQASAQDVGYYASSTLSGTRLNSKIEDIAASVSVVTKQEMSDFAMLDVNDIFQHQVSTEGSATFTNFDVDRNGMVSDGNQANPQGSNRVRGGTAANIAVDNFATSGRVPVDPINIDAVEISRGPNSNIFGIGEGFGTVNLISASANLTRDTTNWEMRVDDIGGYRGSFDVNRRLIEGKLAMRVSAVYQHDEWRQKPSGYTTRRLNVMANFQPWKNTNLRASVQSYNAGGTRPATITPRDTVSYWRSLGSPTWDPVANAVTVNGVTTVLTGNTNPAGLGNSSFQALPSLFIDQKGIGLWMINRMPDPAITNVATVFSNLPPNNIGGQLRFLDTIPDPVRTGHPLFSTVRGVSDKSIYDYSDINLAGINNITDKDVMTTIEFEQTFFRSDKQSLVLQLAWNREDADRYSQNVVGGSSATGNSNYLYVDVNSRLLNGDPNPYFLRPYLGVGYPASNQQPYLRDSYRGQLAYLLNFTKDDGWRKWLGRHQFVGYGEYRKTETNNYRFRDVMLTDTPYNPAGRPKANQSGTASANSARGYFHYYVGDNQGQNIDYAPTRYEYGDYAFNWFNPATNSWVADQVTLGRSAVQEGAGGTAGTRGLIKTKGLILQSFLLDDRIVLSAGWRRDVTASKNAVPTVLQPNGYEYAFPASSGYTGNWQKNEGPTKTKGIVVKPLSWLNFHYNESDSFKPESPAINILGDQLPNPTSNGKDYGFTLNLFKSKFVLRANKYENNQINSRAAETGTYADRSLRMDLEGWAGNNDQQSLQRQARLWLDAANAGDPTWTVDKREAAFYSLAKLTPEQVARWQGSAIRDTIDLETKGEEYEVNWNPDNLWTVKLNVARSESRNGPISPVLLQWINERLEVWTTIIDPRTNTPWYTQTYPLDNPNATATAKSFIDGNVFAPVRLSQATQGKSRPQIREWTVNMSTSVGLAKFTDQRYLKNVTVGGAVRWEDQGAIGYYGIPINGDITIATDYDVNRPIWDKSHAYVDLFFAYNTRMWDDKVRARFQLNVRNVQESHARLQPVGAFPNGEAHTFRIVDPRTFIFTASFGL
jgi:hypothetical protein